MAAHGYASLEPENKLTSCSGPPASPTETMRYSKCKCAFAKTVALISLTLLAYAETKHGVSAAQRNISDLHAAAIYRVGGHPDWMAVTPTATWVADSDRNRVIELDPESTKVKRRISIGKPCSGVAVDFGSLWVPSCRAHAVVRVDLQSGKITARIPVTPANAEGGIATGAGSVWLPTTNGLARIDPTRNKVIALIRIPFGSFAAVFGENAVWVTSTAHNSLTRVDPRSNRVVARIRVGPRPRFLTVGGGSVWSLNQGDGTVSRVDIETNQLLAKIQVGTPGPGGEIAFGAASVWTTAFHFPISQIDPAVNRVVNQWTGAGGDSIRVGNGLVWLTDYKGGTVSRFKLPL